MADPAALRLAVVGPTHPLKGGVAAHTTALAHELADAGHDVVLVSWTALYPGVLYPGEQTVPGGVPDVKPFPRTERLLSWARPDTWVRAGRRLRGVDAVVLVHVVPQVVPAHLALLRAAGAGSPGAEGPRALLIAHNVLPHEPRPGDRALVGALLRRVDSIVVHTAEQAGLAAGLGARHVRRLDLPPHLPGGPPVPRPPHAGPPRVLALGIVRDYKGVDDLLDAAREVPGLEVTVAGELWGAAGERVRALAADPALAGRVEVHGGYVPADRVPALLASTDVLALTYRSASASQNVLLAARHGLPVLATAVGTFPEQVHDGVDGLLVPPGDRAALVAALRRLAEPGYAVALRSGVRPPDLTGPWAHYVGGLEALTSAATATAEPPAAPDPPDVGAPTRPAGRLGRAAAGLPLGAGAAVTRRAESLRRAVRARRAPRTLELVPADLPEDLRPCDLLAV
ncbi:MAG TPA: glycosyltransferase family 4 protein, partial [Dermatophilaceae bacterium]|nr:glycosyltransferase family 4 protein [Dermatophilaceae bacterium]